MTSTALSPMETFQKRLKDKLRDDIADLLPDEALKEMVQRVINEEFFHKKKIQKPGSYNYVDAPSPFQEAVLTAAEPLIKKAVNQVLKENAEKIQQSFDEAVKKGIVSLMISHSDAVIAKVISEQGWNIQQALSKINS